MERFGIHMHIGSGILEVEPYVQAVEKLLSIAKRVHDEVGVNFDFIDIGGGFGVPYIRKTKILIGQPSPAKWSGPSKAKWLSTV